MGSQFGQDVFVLDLLGWKRRGFFLDSGAADGLRSSNTLMMEQEFGWRGICIEPNSEMFASLLKNRRCKCLNLCLFDREGDIEFLENGRMLGGILESYDPQHLQYVCEICTLQENDDGSFVTVRKRCRLPESVLRECGAPSVIDYWSLDTEGSELAILESFPFETYSCRVITVEHNRKPVRQRIRDCLFEHGYRHVAAFGIDDCYAKGVTNQIAGSRSAVWRR
ncbi:FkbM family methyltransferase [Methylocapsa sp. S129]|uniref:FkbM family methyltransferase n=1 Tax=Methylocapsa sp. S129 TaxID=1641869 RepID=UPI00131D18AA|nr:FkbM family methyltransferase [Methylocapsa sp. S129]